MEFKHINHKEMKTLEHYVVACVISIISLNSLIPLQKKGLDLGILKEDEECRLNTLIWDIGRLNRLLCDQAVSVLERVEGDLSIEAILESLKAKELPKKPRKKRNGN